jgi:hypothetical protein
MAPAAMASGTITAPVYPSRQEAGNLPAMPFLEGGDWPLKQVMDVVDFESPFPSTASAAGSKLATLTSAGDAAGQQASAYKNALQLSMKGSWSSLLAGGIRQQWLDKMAWDVEGTRPGDAVVRGLFANFDFPSTLSVGELRNTGVQFGLKAAQAIISGIPVYGQIISAVVDIGKWLFSLVGRDEQEVKLVVPWEEYSQEDDTNMVRAIAKQISPRVDWTALFRPALDVDLRYETGGFRIAPTEEGGETRAYGVFTAGGQADYRSVAEGDDPGIGFMPGTERMADIIQISKLRGGPTWRYDAVTSIGDFTPSAVQYCLAAWSMVNQAGSGDMYKVKVAELIEDWAVYWDAFFEQGLDQVRFYANRKDQESQTTALFLAKALLRFAITENGTYIAEDWLASNGNIQHWVQPGFFEKKDPFQQGWGSYRRIDHVFVLPALRALKQRQKTLLARSLACAYVRPRAVQDPDFGTTLPAFAAFEDTGPAEDPQYQNWGHELRAYCDQMRGLFLTHPDRYRVRDNDAIDVDPVFGRELASTKGITPELDIAARPVDAEPLDPNAADPDEPPFPGGGGPFSIAAPRRRGGGGAGLLVAAAAAALLLKGK